MSKIVIEWTSDTYDCEDCGTSYNIGLTVTCDDVVIHNVEPCAHCYSGPRDQNWIDVVYALTKHLGIEVEEINGGEFAQIKAEYEGKDERNIMS